jgi:lipoate-protein ligase A
MTNLELFPYEVASGPHNMAADEALLEQADRGLALLRFYGWSSATLSLGYFQSHKLRDQDSLISPLPFVRRPTGGATLVHHHELTYALALPPEIAGSSASAWLGRVHSMIAAALTSLGVPTELPAVSPSLATAHPTLCFHQHASVDLLIGASKVLGSAQRKHRGALLQHGSILLARSPHTPTLPGIRELTGHEIGPEDLADRIGGQVVEATGWKVVRRDWSAAEREIVRRIRELKYDQASWNCKR